MQAPGQTAKKRKICPIVVDRANYGRLKPVLEALRDHPEVELQIIAAGTMVLERFDLPVRILREDNLPVKSEVYLELEGSNPITMAKSVGFGIIEFASELQRLQPDMVLVIGDRYEALAATIAAAYMNICIAHIQGGEVSGSIDESARHAISKFAQYHFPSTERAASFLVKMGENPDTILAVGCPSSDIARKLDKSLSFERINTIGSGAQLDPLKPYFLVIFHPTTTEYGGETGQIAALLEALGHLKHQTIFLWPNIDAGSDHVSKAIRRFRGTVRPDWLRTVINLSPSVFLNLLANAACAIGNSSSFVRDSSYFGTPVVLVGNRQNGRERADNVVQVEPRTDAIVSATRAQLKNGRYAPSDLYGDGHAASRIARALSQAPVYVQKTIHYIHEDVPISQTGAGGFPQ